MKKVKVVIGANFGDEGKGHLTDYFSSKEKSSEAIVIRYNSGAQAGHTVTLPDGTRHIFSHFGSGTFCGVPTYLSRFFVVNPMIFQRERNELLKCVTDKGLPQVYASGECLVTTPYDMLLNQTIETVRKDERHGSCGVGFYETIVRSRQTEYKITMSDLWKEDIKERLQRIAKEYVPMRLKDLGLTMDERIAAITESLELVEDTLAAIINIKELVKQREIKEIAKDWQTMLFEGAQGLMLDQSYPFFPHVTPSNTGLKNVIALLTECEEVPKEMEVAYVTRCYLTRHGAGPLPGELKRKPYENIVDHTNQPNEYQGTLRFAYLDVDLLAENIKKDIETARKLVHGETLIERAKVSIAVTCLDQADQKITMIEEGEKRNVTKGKFAKHLLTLLPVETCYEFWGENRECIEHAFLPF